MTKDTFSDYEIRILKDIIGDRSIMANMEYKDGTFTVNGNLDGFNVRVIGAEIVTKNNK